MNREVDRRALDHDPRFTARDLEELAVAAGIAPAALRAALDVWEGRPEGRLSAVMVVPDSVLDVAHDYAHSPRMPSIRSATTADAAALSRLAATTFRETFGAENSPEDMERYLAEAFTPEQQAAEISDTAGTILVAEHYLSPDNVVLVGYAHLISGSTTAAVAGSMPLELKRLYVAREWHGRGVAQALMNSVLDAARARGARTLWLGVWERNPRAVAFYEKYGFTRVGEHSFLLGSDVQTDWVLARPLGDDPKR